MNQDHWHGPGFCGNCQGTDIGQIALYPWHVNIWMVKTILKNGLVTGLLIDDKSQELTQSTACIQGKWHVEPFPKEVAKIAKKICDLIVSDVWGPAQVEGLACGKYFYSYMDMSTRFSGIYFGNTKDETLKNFIVFKEFVETQTSNKLKKFWSDNGGEYVNKAFKDFCAMHEIIMETTAPYSPSQNGIAEWLNQTLLEHACTMISAKNLPKNL